MCMLAINFMLNYININHNTNAHMYDSARARTLLVNLIDLELLIVHLSLKAPEDKGRPICL